jgi:hypothetical protein
MYSKAIDCSPLWWRKCVSAQVIGSSPQTELPTHYLLFPKSKIRTENCYCVLYAMSKKWTQTRVTVCVRLSVGRIQLENGWTDLDEIWNGRYACRVCHKIVLFYFLQSVISTWRTNKFLRWDRHKRHMVFEKKTQYWCTNSLYNVNKNMTAVGNNKGFDVTKIQSHVHVRTSPLRNRRANSHCVALVLIYVTQRRH